MIRKNITKYDDYLLKLFFFVDKWILYIYNPAAIR